MKNEEYYVGYLRNPKDIVTNGFRDIKEMEVIVIHENDDYREIITRKKIYLTDKNHVFQGHQAFTGNFDFIGRIDRKLSSEEALSKIKEIRKNDIQNYLNNLIILNNDTVDMAIESEKSYLEMISKFRQSFRK